MYCYIHIPFCESKCKYCRFASFWISDDIFIKRYVKSIIFDINNFSFNHTKLQSIYFWWWTPSLLKKNYLEEIIFELNKKFWFDINIEITLETTPNFISLENIKSWKEIWINRLSVWIQTLNKKSLKEIWRYNKSTILNSLDILKSNKVIDNISLDFIIWLPYVEKWEIKNNIRFILDNYSFIKQLSVYMLEDYYNSWEEKDKWLKKINDDKFENINYPLDWKNLWIEENDFLEEYISVKEFIEERWFKRYEISNFAKPWYECLHNKSYREHKDNVWFWLSSHSYISWKRFAMKEDFLWYYKKQYKYLEALSLEDIFLEKLMFWLRTSWINKDIYKSLDNNKITKYIEDWYFYYDFDILKISDKWIMLIDYLIYDILK